MFKEITERAMIFLTELIAEEDSGLHKCPQCDLIFTSSEGVESAEYRPDSDGVRMLCPDCGFVAFVL